MVCVLLVEDDHALRVIMAEILRCAGYDIMETDNGLDALGLLASHKIDVLLTDIEIPGLDGLRLLGAVKRRFPAVVAMVISGHFSHAEAAKQLGADCYLSKPCSREQLVNAVENTLKQATAGVS
jgi:YesN/AraC family two-component response regulator